MKNRNWLNRKQILIFGHWDSLGVNMDNRIIRLSELIDYHKLDASFDNTIACFQLDNKLVNIDTIPPAFADIFSFVLVREGTAVFSLNNRKYVVGKGDLLLFYPSLLVSLTRQSSDFVALHLLCERTFFERLLASRPLYQAYSLFFCRVDSPVLRLTVEQAEDLAGCMRQITRAIIHPVSYREDLLLHLLHACLLLVLDWIERRGRVSPTGLKHGEVLFQQFISLLMSHYKKEHYIGFYARSLSISSTYLSRVIRSSTGKTAAYFITGLLFAEACRLLVHTDWTIQAIADELCFSDQSAFGKFFKANAGVSPRFYRLKKYQELSWAGEK